VVVSSHEHTVPTHVVDVFIGKHGSAVVVGSVPVGIFHLHHPLTGWVTGAFGSTMTVGGYQ